MQALKLPADRGWQWLVQGYALFRRQPALIGLMVMSYWLSLILFNILPVIGPIVASLVMPGLSVGVLTACRNLDRGLPVSMALFVQPIKEHTRPLVLLGAIYLACTLGALALVSGVDGGALFASITTGKPLDDAAIEEGSILMAAQLVLLFMTPVLMAYWYAPMLAAWHQLGVGKALFFSFIACLRNWRAFLVYGLGLVGIAAILPGLVVGLVSSLFPAAAGFITSMLTLPLLLILAPTVFASFYISYRDVFIVQERISEHA